MDRDRQIEHIGIGALLGEHRTEHIHILVLMFGLTVVIRIADTGGIGNVNAAALDFAFEAQMHMGIGRAHYHECEQRYPQQAGPTLEIPTHEPEYARLSTAGASSIRSQLQ